MFQLKNIQVFHSLARLWLRADRAGVIPSPSHASSSRLHLWGLTQPRVLPKGFPPYLGSSPEKGRHGVAEKNPECSNSSLSSARWHTACLIAAFSEHNSSIQICYATLQCEVVSSGPKVSSQDSCIAIQWLREDAGSM